MRKMHMGDCHGILCEIYIRKSKTIQGKIRGIAKNNRPYYSQDLFSGEGNAKQGACGIHLTFERQRNRTD